MDWLQVVWPPERWPEDATLTLSWRHSDRFRQEPPVGLRRLREALPDLLSRHRHDDCYLDLAPRRAGAPGYKSSASTALGLPGLFVDLDVGEDTQGGHAQHLPDGVRLPTWEEADELLAALGLPVEAALLIRTGGGYQAVWPSEEPLEPRSPLIQRWAGAALQAASERGLHLDRGPLSAPSQMVRVPGTRNIKYDPPRAVELLSEPSRLLTLADLERLLPELPPRPRPRRSTPSGAPTELHGGAADAWPKAAQAFSRAVPVGELVEALGIGELCGNRVRIHETASESPDQAAVIVGDDGVERLYVHSETLAEEWSLEPVGRLLA